MRYPRLPSFVMVVLLSAFVLSACSKGGSSGTSASEPSKEQSASIEQMATHWQAGRQDELLERARSKGPVLLYTSNPVSEVTMIVGKFRKKYGLEVKVYRGGSSGGLINRVLTESKAGRLVTDVVWANDNVTHAIDSEKLLASFEPENKADYPQALRTSANTYPVYVNYWMWAYNTKLVKPSELPHTYQDLLNPRWKNKITIARYPDWLSVLWGIIGEQKAKSYLHALNAQKPFVVKQFTPALLPVESGEKELTMSIVSGVLEAHIKKGAPLEGYFPDDPTPARTSAVGWFAKGGNPAGGLLFADYLLSPEGQRLFKAEHRVPADEKITPDPPSLRPKKYVLVDYAKFGSQEAMWQKRFDEFFGK